MEIFRISFLLTNLFPIARAAAVGLRSNPNAGNSQLPLDPVIKQHPFPSAFREFSSYAVTTDSEICSKIGRSILDKKGTAVDAAIAAMLCVGVVSSQSNGIGGGFLAAIYAKPRSLSKKILLTLMARERAPNKATVDMFRNVSSTVGGLAIAVPGEIKGYYEAWKLFGNRDWAELVKPTIDLCLYGIPVEKRLATVLKSMKTEILADPNLRALYGKTPTTVYEEGDLMKNLKLARTLKTIAKDPESYYKGKLAKDIVDDIRERGGIISLEDLKEYRVEWKKPVQMNLRGGIYVINSPPPPSSGVVTNFIMALLDGYNFTPDWVRKNYVLFNHRIVEAMKYAYASRSRMGDEAFVDLRDLKKNLTSAKFIEDVRAKIDDLLTYNISHYVDTIVPLNDHGTSHLNVLAKDGSAVSMTSTINTLFGSLVLGRKSGILFNNEMDDFSSPNSTNFYGYQPSQSNYIRPKKVPMSSMSPSIVLNRLGQVVYTSGASGGSKIISSIAWVMIRTMLLDQHLLDATNSARMHHQLSPNLIDYEHWFDKDSLTGLEGKGHKLRSIENSAICGSILNVCNKESEGRWVEGRSQMKCIHSISDGRKGGAPAGV